MDNKVLIILAFYFNVEGMTRSDSDRALSGYNKVIDREFGSDMENYTIKTFIFPTNYTKMECIYPINTNNTLVDIDVEHQLKKVETEILKHKDPKLWDEWTTLMRWAKLRNLKNNQNE